MKTSRTFVDTIDPSTQESGLSVAAATTSVRCPHTTSIVCTVWCMLQNYKVTIVCMVLSLYAWWPLLIIVL